MNSAHLHLLNHTAHSQRAVAVGKDRIPTCPQQQPSILRHLFQSLVHVSIWNNHDPQLKNVG